MSIHPTSKSRELILIKKLLEKFHISEINYCHWKGNANIDNVMKGDSDLDILIDESQEEEVDQILTDLGFKLFHAIPFKQYDGIFDYLGIDMDSGKLVHVHAHFKLRFGHQFLLEYPLGLEAAILQDRVFDEINDLYKIDPSFEYVLFFIRESLKLRHRDVLRFKIKGIRSLPQKRRNEHMWLKSNMKPQHVMEILEKHFEDHKSIFSLVQKDLSLRLFLELRNIFRKELKPKRKFSGRSGFYKRIGREMIIRFREKYSSLFYSPMPTRRVNIGKGLIVALIGADGSGKSTVSADLYNTFHNKLDVFPIYFGRGDGRSSLLRKVLEKFKGILRVNRKNKDRKKSSISIRNRKPLDQLNIFHQVYKCLQALTVAKEKKNNLNRMLAARKKGMLVICDRFPQNQIMGFNDGPLLDTLKESKNLFLRLAARIESKTYKDAVQTPPDILIKLIASPEIVEARKPGETSLENLKTKIAGIEQLQFNHSCEVITLDASKPLHQVLSRVKEVIWNKM